MSLRSRFALLFATVGLAGLMFAGLDHLPRAIAQAEVPADPVPEADFGGKLEVLTRGPVHEAFANPVDAVIGKTVAVKKAPAAAIEELPPSEKPAGENVVWIGGYWQWDDEREDFLWIAGIWRVIPPGQQWVSGYWSESDGGWRWTPGFWASIEREEVAYLPEPPEPIAEGIREAPSDDHFWVPGVWRYVDSRYVWRGGYYTRAMSDWTWVPAHYVFCHGGYVFVDGYWDYPVEERGVIFAPVYFHEPIYRRADFYYTPSIAIDTGLLHIHLFARPRYHHYYFGDYYAPRYAEIGIYPWFQVRSYSRFNYDPIFTYYSHHYGRRDRDWSVRIEQRYDYLRRHEEHRPPQTLIAQQTYIKNNNTTVVNTTVNNTTVNNIVNVRNNALGVPLNQLAKAEKSNLRLERVNQERRQELVQQTERQREFTRERVKSEAALEAPGRNARATQLATLKLATPSPEARAAARRTPEARNAATAGTGDVGRRRDDTNGRGRDDGPRLGDPSGRPRTGDATTVPRLGDTTPRTGNTVPRLGDNAPRTGDATGRLPDPVRTPRNDDTTRPRIGDTTGRTGDTSPRRDINSRLPDPVRTPRTGDATPRNDNGGPISGLRPRETDTGRPRLGDTTPRTTNPSPRATDTSPRIDSRLPDPVRTPRASDNPTTTAPRDLGGLRPRDVDRGNRGADNPAARTQTPAPSITPRTNPSVAPRVDTPRTDIPRLDRGGDGPRRDQTPRANPDAGRARNETPTPRPSLANPAPTVTPRATNPNPTPAPRVETPRIRNPEPRPNPTPTPRAEAPRVRNPEPRANPTPAPRVNPTPAPKVNPTPQPNPTPAVRANPTPAPKANPTPPAARAEKPDRGQRGGKDPKEEKK